MKLRILESQWAPFVNTLCARRDVETAGIILAERLHGGTVLYARHLSLVPNQGYAVRRVDQLRIDPVAFNRLIRPAREGGLSVITVHTHPGSDLPWFSAADDAGDSRLMPSLFAQMPGPHGSVVLAGETGMPMARVWDDAGRKTEVQVNIVGKTLRIPTFADGLLDQGWFDRQRLALGDEGQRALRSLHVAVVGLGGTGSVSFAQLVHLGVGRITVIDGDRVSNSNISRILGATSHDAGIAWKVDVAARYAESVALGTEVTVIRGQLGTDVSPSEIEGCDIVLSCVDQHLPRALLNRLAYEKAIPIIDMGSVFRTNSSGGITAGAGRVVIVGPERRCLACWGHVDPDRIRIEALAPADRASLAKEGYVHGADVPQPSVIAFNTTVAGAAVIELLRLVTHYAGVDNPPMRLSFDFLTGTVRRNVLSPPSLDAHCKICFPESAMPEKLKVKLNADFVT
jgi:molybdopterin-synthase adenylyltransferase